MPAHNIKDSAFAVDENDKITAKAMCTIEKESGRILYAKNENEKLPMASLTKIITAIVVIENTNNLEEVIAIPKEAVGIEGSSIYLKEGEHLSILSLLYGLMLQSGNDCAVALAINTSKSVENFIKLANDFCKKIGATSTNLVTPNGLHDDNHYTTAYDLAKISAYAMKNEIFKKIVGTKSIKIEREKGNYPVVIKNKNKLLKNMENATGIKTGYTKKAGRCFVGSAQKNGMEVICVLLNCNPMFQECENLLNKAFDEFSMVNLLDEYKTRNVSVLNGEKPSVLVCSNSGFNFPLKDEEKTNISIIENVPNSINAPIKANESVGEIEIYLKNDLIFCEKIYTIEEVKANDYFSKLKRIIEGF
ncbi:MAG: D-alanyl-D-alanine carboxypeptidase [Clostridia bacterium]|nr:D-alanyl-D-alanine carboxypeptidase [Clostridia bacterium]